MCSPYSACSTPSPKPSKPRFFPQTEGFEMQTRCLISPHRGYSRLHKNGARGWKAAALHPSNQPCHESMSMPTSQKSWLLVTHFGKKGGKLVIPDCEGFTCCQWAAHGHPAGSVPSHSTWTNCSYWWVLHLEPSPAPISIPALVHQWCVAMAVPLQFTQIVSHLHVPAEKGEKWPFDQQE